MRRHSSRYLTVAMVIVAVIATIAVPIVASSIETLEKWASLVGALTAVAAVVLTTPVVFAARMESTKTTERKSVAAYELIREFATLEHLAEEALGKQQSASLIRAREGLVSSGIWSDGDLVIFDKALRVRNTIVHGDADMLDSSDITEAIETMRRLSAAIRSSETTK